MATQMKSLETELKSHWNQGNYEEVYKCVVGLKDLVLYGVRSVVNNVEINSTSGRQESHSLFNLISVVYECYFEFPQDAPDYLLSASLEISYVLFICSNYLDFPIQSRGAALASLTNILSFVAAKDAPLFNVVMEDLFASILAVQVIRDYVFMDTSTDPWYKTVPLFHNSRKKIASLLGSNHIGSSTPHEMSIHLSSLKDIDVFEVIILCLLRNFIQKGVIQMRLRSDVFLSAIRVVCLVSIESLKILRTSIEAELIFPSSTSHYIERLSSWDNVGWQCYFSGLGNTDCGAGTDQRDTHCYLFPTIDTINQNDFSHNCPHSRTFRTELESTMSITNDIATTCGRINVITLAYHALRSSAWIEIMNKLLSILKSSTDSTVLINRVSEKDVGVLTTFINSDEGIALVVALCDTLKLLMDFPPIVMESRAANSILLALLECFQEKSSYLFASTCSIRSLSLPATKESTKSLAHSATINQFPSNFLFEFITDRSHFGIEQPFPLVTPRHRRSFQLQATCAREFPKHSPACPGGISLISDLSSYLACLLSLWPLDPISLSSINLLEPWNSKFPVAFSIFLLQDMSATKELKTHILNYFPPQSFDSFVDFLSYAQILNMHKAATTNHPFEDNGVRDITSENNILDKKSSVLLLSKEESIMLLFLMLLRDFGESPMHPSKFQDIFNNKTTAHKPSVQINFELYYAIPLLFQLDGHIVYCFLSVQEIEFAMGLVGYITRWREQIQSILLDAPSQYNKECFAQIFEVPLQYLITVSISAISKQFNPKRTEEILLNRIHAGLLDQSVTAINGFENWHFLNGSLSSELNRLRSELSMQSLPSILQYLWMFALDTRHEYEEIFFSLYSDATFSEIQGQLLTQATQELVCLVSCISAPHYPLLYEHLQTFLRKLVTLSRKESLNSNPLLCSRVLTSISMVTSMLWILRSGYVPPINSLRTITSFQTDFPVYMRKHEDYPLTCVEFILSGSARGQSNNMDLYESSISDLISGVAHIDLLVNILGESGEYETEMLIGLRSLLFIFELMSITCINTLLAIINKSLQEETKSWEERILNAYESQCKLLEIRLSHMTSTKDSSVDVRAIIDAILNEADYSATMPHTYSLFSETLQALIQQVQVLSSGSTHSFRWKSEFPCMISSMIPIINLSTFFYWAYERHCIVEMTEQLRKKISSVCIGFETKFSESNNLGITNIPFDIGTDRDKGSAKSFNQFPDDIKLTTPPLLDFQSIQMSLAGKVDALEIPEGLATFIVGMSHLGLQSIGASENDTIAFLDTLKKTLQERPTQEKSADHVVSLSPFSNGRKLAILESFDKSMSTLMSLLFRAGQDSNQSQTVSADAHFLTCSACTGMKVDNNESLYPQLSLILRNIDPTLILEYSYLEQADLTNPTHKKATLLTSFTVTTLLSLENLVFTELDAITTAARDISAEAVWETRRNVVMSTLGILTHFTPTFLSFNELIASSDSSSHLTSHDVQRKVSQLQRKLVRLIISWMLDKSYSSLHSLIASKFVSFLYLASDHRSGVDNVVVGTDENDTSSLVSSILMALQDLFPPGCLDAIPCSLFRKDLSVSEWKVNYSSHYRHSSYSITDKYIVSSATYESLGLEEHSPLQPIELLMSGWEALLRTAAFSAIPNSLPAPDVLGLYQEKDMVDTEKLGERLLDLSMLMNTMVLVGREVDSTRFSQLQKKQSQALHEHDFDNISTRFQSFDTFQLPRPVQNLFSSLGDVPDGFLEDSMLRVDNQHKSMDFQTPKLPVPYHISEILLYSPRGYLSAALLAILDIWFTAKITSIHLSLVLLNQPKDDTDLRTFENANADAVEAMLSFQEQVCGVAKTVFRSIASQYGYSSLGLIQLLAPEILPRIAFVLFSDQPQHLCPKSLLYGSKVYDHHHEFSCPPLVFAFLNQFCDEPSLLHTFLSVNKYIFLPSLCTVDGGYFTHIALYGWILHLSKREIQNDFVSKRNTFRMDADSAAVVESMTKKPGSAISSDFPNGSPSRQIELDRTGKGTTLPSLRQKRARSVAVEDLSTPFKSPLLSSFANTKPRDLYASANASGIHQSRGLGDDINLAIFNFREYDLARLQQFAYELLKSTEDICHVYYRILITPCPPEFSQRISHVLVLSLMETKKLAHTNAVPRQGSNKILAENKFHSRGVFDTVLWMLMWSLVDELIDSPLNRASLALRQFAVLLIGSPLFVAVPSYRISQVRLAISELANEQCKIQDPMRDITSQSVLRDDFLKQKTLSTQGKSGKLPADDANDGSDKVSKVVDDYFFSATFPEGKPVFWHHFPLNSTIPDILYIAQLSTATYYLQNVPRYTLQRRLNQEHVDKVGQNATKFQYLLEDLLVRYLLWFVVHMTRIFHERTRVVKSSSMLQQVFSPSHLSRFVLPLQLSQNTRHTIYYPVHYFKEYDINLIRLRCICVLQRILTRIDYTIASSSNPAIPSNTISPEMVQRPPVSSSKLDKHIHWIIALLLNAFDQGSRFPQLQVAAGAVWVTLPRLVSDETLKNNLPILVVGLLTYITENASNLSDSGSIQISYSKSDQSVRDHEQFSVIQNIIAANQDRNREKTSWNYFLKLLQPNQFSVPFSMHHLPEYLHACMVQIDHRLFTCKHLQTAGIISCAACIRSLALQYFDEKLSRGFSSLHLATQYTVTLPRFQPQPYVGTARLDVFGIPKSLAKQLSQLNYRPTLDSKMNLSVDSDKLQYVPNSILLWPLAMFPSIRDLCARLLRFLLVEKNVNFEGALPSLTTLSIPEDFLAPIRKVVRDDISKFFFVDQVQSSTIRPGTSPELMKLAVHTGIFENRVRRLLTLVRQNLVKVDLLALRELHVLFLRGNAAIKKALTMHEIMNPLSNLLTDAMQTLLYTIRTRSDANIRATAAACLGYIGAIDPARFGQDKILILDVTSTSINQKGQTSIKTELPDRKLVIVLIRDHLADMLRSTPLHERQNKIGYALQQLLNVYKKFVPISEAPISASKKEKAIPSSQRSSRSSRSSARKVAAANTSGDLSLSQLNEPESGSTSYCDRGVFMPTAIKDAMRDDLNSLFATRESSDEESVEDPDYSGLFDVLTPYWTSSLIFLKRPPSGMQSENSYVPFFSQICSNYTNSQRFGNQDRHSFFKSSGRPPSFVHTSESRKNSLFDKWISHWTRWLIMQLHESAKTKAGDQTESTEADYCLDPEIWEAVSAVTDDSPSVALFLLPYLIRDCCIRHSALQKCILLEINQVLSSGGPDEVFGATESNGLPTTVPLAETESTDLGELSQKCVQCVFSLTDIFQAWIVDNESRIQKLPPDANDPSALVVKSANGRHATIANTLKNIVGGINTKSLVASAISVRSFTRACIYLEELLRNQNTMRYGGDIVPFGSARIPPLEPGNHLDVPIGGLISNHIPYSRSELLTMQNIYANVDEPDGLKGIRTLRLRLLNESLDSNDILSTLQREQEPRQETLMAFFEAITDYEHNADWEKALLCYEQVLAMYGKQLYTNFDISTVGTFKLHEASGSINGDGQAASLSSAVSPLAYVNVHKGLFTCLLHLGYYQIALNHILGVVFHEPQYSQELVPLAIQACWKCGNWELLQQLLPFVKGANRYTSIISDYTLTGHKTVLMDDSGNQQSPVADYSSSIGNLEEWDDSGVTRPVAIGESDDSSYTGDFDTTVGLSLYLLRAARKQAEKHNSITQPGAVMSPEPADMTVHSVSSAKDRILDVPSMLQILEIGAKVDAIGKDLLFSTCENCCSIRNSGCTCGTHHTSKNARLALEITGLLPFQILDRYTLPVVPTIFEYAHSMRRASFPRQTLSVRKYLLSQKSLQRVSIPAFSQPGGQYYNYISPLVENIELVLRIAREEVTKSLSAAAMESYSRVYPAMLQLQSISEIEQALQLLFAHPKDVRKVLTAWEWDKSLSLVTPSIQARSSLLSIRRAIYEIFGLSDLEVNSWLDIAHSAQIVGHSTTATSAIRKARSMGSEVASLLAAEMLAASGDLYRGIMELEPYEVDLRQVASNALQTLQQSQAKLARSNPSEALEANEQEILPAEFNLRLQARKLLSVTTWLAQGKFAGEDTIIQRYRLINELLPKWESSRFALAQYFDERMREMSEGNIPSYRKEMQALRIWTSRRDTYAKNAVQYYTKSLVYGHKHVYSSLPRILTIYLDYGASVSALLTQVKSLREQNRLRPTDQDSEVIYALRDREPIDVVKRTGFRCAQVETLQEMGIDMRKMVEQVPVNRLYTALSQLSSRICHRNDDVARFISMTLKKLVVSFPMQTTWGFLGLTKSRIFARQSRAQEVIQQAKETMMVDSPQSGEFFPMIDQLFNDVIALAREMPPQNVKTYRVSICEGQYGNFVSLRDAKIIVPILSNLAISLPHIPSAASMRSLLINTVVNKSTTAGFPLKPLLIDRFEKTADVMTSKERPKKLTILTDDGRSIAFLAKREHRGDLRKDARTMETSGVINRLLSKDPEGQRRKLTIRTFTVICLNEDSGLIEWVPNTSGLRNEIAKVYNAYGYSNPVSILRACRKDFEAIQELEEDPSRNGERVTLYREKILSRFPAILHKWYTMNFSTPAQWFDARINFSRSSATWSMVGHIVGLGDRHGENIMLDYDSGYVVHVDFDCLFDKGLQLAKPEVVPFRLTPNMLDALGLSGYEGIFRSCSEITMRVLRRKENKDTLLSVLESFIQDPLVEWNKSDDPRSHPNYAKHTGCEAIISTATGAEIEHVEGVRIVKRVSERLDGFYNSGAEECLRMAIAANKGNKRDLLALPNPTALEVQGQVTRLLHEATSDLNLSRMYIGWMGMM